MPPSEADLLRKMSDPAAIAERRRKAFDGAVIPTQEEIDKLVHPRDAAKAAAPIDPKEDIFRETAEIEGLLLDICLERAVKIVTKNFLAAGGASSPEGGGTIMSFVETAGPLSIELYRQCLAAIREAQHVAKVRTAGEGVPAGR